ncbi:MAG TPA: adenosylcobinamide-GDP ribazoletransferase [Oscillospiraceae bacterium]|nr:adenosylcobinamide-GDP ribazoletransferase [Oscillospiraceae bacterium]
MKRFFVALRFLTVYPFGGDTEVTTDDLVGSATYYPIVGALIGLTLYGFWLWANTVLSTLLAATLTVTLWELISAGLHLDGLMDTADGLGVRGNLEKRLEVMKDSRVGAFGAQVLVLSMLLKVFAVASLAADARLLIIAPLVGRTVMVALMATCDYARPSGGLGKIFVDELGTTQLFLAILLCLVLGFAAWGWQMLPLTLALIVVFAILRYFFKLNFGGVTGDILGAVCELFELAVLLIAPLLFL